MKEYSKKDEDYIKQCMQALFHGDQVVRIQRLGGLTNHSYRIDTNHDSYVFRIPGEGTQELINRKEERISNMLACSLGIDCDLFFMDNQGVKIMAYIPEAKTMDATQLQQAENMEKVATIFRTLHHCKVDTGVHFDVMEMANRYENYIVEHDVLLFPAYVAYKKRVLRIYNTMKLSSSAFVPCHNDPLCENWVRSNDRMYLIDWEYAGMNDPLWDLADVSIEAQYQNHHDQILLQHYCNGKPSKEMMQRFLANKIYLDYVWSLWGKTRVMFDCTMEEYANQRYERMIKMIDEWESAYV